MSGADWRQQEELEEQQWHEELMGSIDVCEFVQGQAHRIDGKMLPRNASKSFMRGWIAQNAIEDIKRELL